MNASGRSLSNFRMTMELVSFMTPLLMSFCCVKAQKYSNRSIRLWKRIIGEGIIHNMVFGLSLCFIIADDQGVAVKRNPTPYVAIAATAILP